MLIMKTNVAKMCKMENFFANNAWRPFCPLMKIYTKTKKNDGKLSFFFQIVESDECY